MHSDISRFQLLRIAAVAAVCTGFGAVPASAQALLERVLTQITFAGGDITGIFANTADNIARQYEVLPLTLQAYLDGEETGVDPSRVYIGDGPLTTLADYLATGALPGFSYYSGGGAAPPADARIVAAEVPDGAGGTRTVYVLGRADGSDFVDGIAAAEISGAEGFVVTESDFDTATGAEYGRTEVALLDTVFGSTERVEGRIDASVLNVLSGAAAAAAAQSAVSDRLSATIGNIGTTGLGAVNTGEILLRGAGIALDETIARALGGTSAAIESRVSAAVTQAGTATGGTLIALNGALNTSGVEASVISVMSGLDVTIGRSGFEAAVGDSTFAELSALDPAMISALTGGVGTTALGAVNTGGIVSGTQTLVQGVISGIVGSSGGDG